MSGNLDDLVEAIKRLRKSEVRSLIDDRIREFRENGKKSITEIFKELCFCLLTANFNAERSLKIQEEIGNGFLKLPEHELAEKLRGLGHRYPVTRAKYIVDARKMIRPLRDILQSSMNEEALREWLTGNIRGLGYKEASHFLRNMGFMNLAIIDFHVINILSKYGLISGVKTLTKRRYREIEKLLREVAKRIELSLGELDLYLWFMETGKVLK